MAVTNGDVLDPADESGLPAEGVLPREADGPRPPGAEPADALPRSRRRMSWFSETIIFVVIALVISLTVKTYIVEPFKIPSQSMENTLLVNDKVLVNKLVGHISQIHRGDIVVFDGNGVWYAPTPVSGNPLDRVYRNFLSLFGDHSGEVDYIKRVIGLPGDHVVCCNAQGLLTVNGTPLHESGYLYPGSQPSMIRFSVVVPRGDLWVMGDNRGDSSDSRYHRCGIPGALCASYDRSGAVPESSVIGRAFMIVWPPSQFRVVWVPATFSQSGLLVAGGIAAAPLTLLERRIRLRRRAGAKRRWPRAPAGQRSSPGVDGSVEP